MRNQPCGEIAAVEAFKRTQTVRNDVAMCGQSECRVCEAVYRWMEAVRVEIRGTRNRGRFSSVTYIQPGPLTSSERPAHLFLLTHQAYHSYSGLRTSFTPFYAYFLFLAPNVHPPEPDPPTWGRVRMGFLEEAMDTAIDLSNASKALDLANIRFQLM